MRALIERIVLTPGPERSVRQAQLYGNLGATLNWIESQAVEKATKSDTPGEGRTECRSHWSRGQAISGFYKCLPSPDRPRGCGLPRKAPVARDARERASP